MYQFGTGANAPATAAVGCKPAGRWYNGCDEIMPPEFAMDPVDEGAFSVIGGLNMTELIVILIIALLVFGPSRLPQMGKAIGSTIKEFRSATSKGQQEPETKPEEKK